MGIQLITNISGMHLSTAKAKNPYNRYVKNYLNGISV